MLTHIMVKQTTMKKLLLSLLLSFMTFTTHAQSTLLGDVNNDGKVTVTDAMMVVDIIMHGYKYFSVDPTTVSLPVGGTATMEISGGYDSYEVISSNTAIAEASLSGTTITLTAIASGEAKVIVKDVQTLRYIEIPVTVEYASLQLSSNELILNAGNQGSLAITSGSGSYSVQSSDANVAIASLNANLVIITAVAVGTATITITDRQSGESATIEVIVNMVSDDEAVNLDHDLRVFIMGNSYTLDVTAYLEDLIRAANINLDQLGIYAGIFNGGQLADWVSRYNSDVTLQKMAGNIIMNETGSVKELLNQEWDLIVLLQASNVSYDWSTFEKSLPELLSIIHENCINKDVKIAYQIPWGHTEDTAPQELAGNIECTQKLMEEFEITDIIPIGTAVQNARNTSLNTPLYLTRDNWHLCMGVGRYLAACTFFESVITPISHISVLGNTAIHQLTDDEKYKYNGSVAVDETNRLLCQLCALNAVKFPFVVTIPDN